MHRPDIKARLGVTTTTRNTQKYRRSTKTLEYRPGRGACTCRGCMQSLHITTLSRGIYSSAVLRLYVGCIRIERSVVRYLVMPSRNKDRNEEESVQQSKKPEMKFLERRFPRALQKCVQTFRDCLIISKQNNHL